MNVIQVIPGTSIIHVRYKATLPDNFVEYINACIENMISEYKTFSIQIDLKGLNITTFMKNKAWVESMLSQLDTNTFNNYLAKVYVFNTPFIAKQIYAIMSRYVKDYKAKIVFVPKEQLSEYFHPEFAQDAVEQQMNVRFRSLTQYFSRRSEVRNFAAQPTNA